MLFPDVFREYSREGPEGSRVGMSSADGVDRRSIT